MSGEPTTEWRLQEAPLDDHRTYWLVRSTRPPQQSSLGWVLQNDSGTWTARNSTPGHQTTKNGRTREQALAKAGFVTAVPETPELEPYVW